MEALEQEVSGRSDGGAKRRQIMEGARQVFLSSGFDGASMNDVARAAGVSKGTLYAYFNSKEELFEAIIRGEKSQSAERMCAFPREGDPREMLTDFGVRPDHRMAEPSTLALSRVVIAAAEKFPNIGRTFFEAGPLYGNQRLAGGCGSSSRRGGQRSRSRARRLALSRSLPERRVQEAPVRRCRFDEPRGHRSLGRGGRRGVSEGVWRRELPNNSGRRRASEGRKIRR